MFLWMFYGSTKLYLTMASIMVNLFQALLKIEEIYDLGNEDNDTVTSEYMEDREED